MNTKIYSGILKKIPTEEHFEKFRQKQINLNEVKIRDTIREVERDNEIIQYLPVKLSYSELDENGNEKFILNDEGDFEKVYCQTPVLYAYGKEMRILSEMNENHPLKIGVQEINLGERIIHKVIIVQDNSLGKL